MKEKKPTKAQQIAAETFKFLDAAVTAGKAPTEGSFVGNAGLDRETLAAIVFAVQFSKSAGVLDAGQYACLVRFLKQVADQVPTPVREALKAVVDHARWRDEERVQKRLYDAAMVSPSRN
jgi:hypothetical protein